MGHALDNTAAEYFGGMTDSYDSLILRCVPGYERMSRRLLDYLPGEIGRVLELGSGTGNLTRRLATRYPDAELVFVDASPEMVELTTHRLGEHRARGIVGRFEDLPRLVEGPFDIVTSCLSLHHVADKAPLYRSIAALLAPGGTFRFADQLRGGTDGNHDTNWRLWLEFCRRPDHCDEAEVQSLLDHAEAHDHYTPLAEHFALLEDAELTGVDCVWRDLTLGIVTADRPDSV